ncbi:MAG: ArsR family transcriptional regulator [Promethearchaeota archaeon]
MSNLIIDNRVNQSELLEVIKIAEEMISQNKPIKMEKLYKIAKRELKFTATSLFLIIKKLFDDKHIIEGSKLIRDKILQNPNRAIIYRFIKNHPGVNFSTIKKCAFSKRDKRIKTLLDSKEASFGSSGQFIWHLEILLKFKCIKKIEFKNFSLFTVYKMDDTLIKYYFLLRDNLNRKIFNLLREKNTMKQAKIPKILGKTKGTVYYHLKIMIEEEILCSEEINGTLYIKLNPDKIDILTRIRNDLEGKLLKLREQSTPPLKKSVEEIKMETIKVKDKIVREKKKEIKEKTEQKLGKILETKLELKPKKKKKEEPLDKTKKRGIKSL